jgi:phage terminase large subunit-like protein
LVTVAVTVIVAVPFFPSLVAVSVALPAATAVTRPLADTVATAGALLAQVTTRPVKTLPAESFVVAASCTVPPIWRLAEFGLTATDATGGIVTVTVAVPLFPPLVAVSVAVPAATPVTNPLPFTLATPGALLAQVTTRPVSTLPAESVAVAVSCTVPPTRILGAAGVTATAATGMIVTVIEAVPLLPSLVAVSVALPAATPVTSPLAETLATPGALLAHVTRRPVKALPFASLGVAVNWAVCPMRTVAAAGLTATDATGTTVTVMAAVPF